MADHDVAPRGAPSRLPACFAIAALVVCCLVSRTAAAQVGGVNPIFAYTTAPPFAPAGGFLGINISWEPTVCVSNPLTMVVRVGTHSYSTTWSRTSGIGVLLATYVLSGGRAYVVSDDKTHRLNNPTLTVECIIIQWKISVVSTESFIFYGEHVLANTGTESQVSPPKPKMMLNWGNTSGTALTINLPVGEAAPVSLDASGSGPTEEGGPSISSYSWTKNNAVVSNSMSFVSTFSSTASVSLSVTDEIAGSASQFGSVTIEPVYPCDDPFTDEVEDCNSNEPGGGEEISYGGRSEQPGWYLGGAVWSTYVCYVTDWYEWTGSHWVYTDTVVDYCTFE